MHHNSQVVLGAELNALAAADERHGEDLLDDIGLRLWVQGATCDCSRVGRQSRLCCTVFLDGPPLLACMHACMCVHVACA